MAIINVEVSDEIAKNIWNVKIIKIEKLFHIYNNHIWKYDDLIEEARKSKWFSTHEELMNELMN